MSFAHRVSAQDVVSRKSLTQQKKKKKTTLKTFVLYFIFKNRAAYDVLVQGSAGSFCKGSDSTCFKLCGPRGLWYLSALPLQLKRMEMDESLCPGKTFTLWTLRCHLIFTRRVVFFSFSFFFFSLDQLKMETLFLAHRL